MPKNPDNPRKGTATKVEPIRSKRAINNIKKLLADQPRDLCLFTLGINTGYRANELLSITVGQIRHLKPGDSLTIRQSKNSKHRTTPLNRTAINAVQHWLAQDEAPQNNAEPLFRGQRGALTVSTVSKYVKQWCSDAGLKGNYASHSMRKTWGYWQRVGNGAALSLLVDAYGHSSEKQTLDYLCIQPEEISDLYEMEL